jgi:hypothetical protein
LVPCFKDDRDRRLIICSFSQFVISYKQIDSSCI